MNVQKLCMKIFLGIYLFLLLPDIFEMSFSVTITIIFIFGFLFASIAHQSTYKMFATVFLVLHMVLELPHMIEHFGHDGLGVILGHGVHVIFDFILLYAFSRTIKYFIGFVIIIVSAGFLFSLMSVPFFTETKPFVLGGVLGCISMHLLGHKLFKKIVH